jgi:hypothetical protein
MRSETYSCARQQVGGRFQKFTKSAEGAKAAEGIWRTTGMYGLSCLYTLVLWSSCPPACGNVDSCRAVRKRKKQKRNRGRTR